MIRIEISPNDKRDLLELLDILKEHPEVFNEKYDLANYWLMRIKQLRMAINGINLRDNIIQAQRLDNLTREEKRKLAERELIKDVLNNR